MHKTDKTGWTVGNVLARQSQALGDRPFVQLGDEAPWTFEKMDQAANRIANALAALGIKPGERVVVMMPNSVEFLLMWFGISRLGAVFVPINTANRGAFLEHQLNNCGARIFLIDREFVPVLQASEAAVPKGEIAVVADVSRSDSALPEFIRFRVMAFEEFLAYPDTPVEGEVTYRDIGAIMYTSGTTGPSKGVLMPHAHMYLFTQLVEKVARLTSNDVYYCCLPLVHINGLFLQAYSSLVAGCRLVLVKNFSASRWIDHIRQYGATVTNILGIMTEFIYNQPPRPEDSDNRLRIVFAAPIAPELGKNFEKRFGVRLLEFYGMTEINLPSCTSYDEPLRAPSCGKVFDEWFEMKIVDPETDEELPPETVGEIVVRPKEPWCSMAGYNDMPEITVETWRNFWFHTGDAGTCSADGYFTFIDRIKDRIRRRGENISSYEIESVLNVHPAVAESAVVAVNPNAQGREDEIKACVVLRPGISLRPEELLDYCQQRMPYFVVPRYVEFLSEIPKTPTQKIQKHKLRDRGLSSSTWDREAAGYKVRKG